MSLPETTELLQSLSADESRPPVVRAFATMALQDAHPPASRASLTQPSARDGQPISLK